MVYWVGLRFPDADLCPPPFLFQGDCLLAINGTSVAGWTLEEAEEYVNKLGDPVELTTTCLQQYRQLRAHDFLHVTDADPEDIAAAKEDLR